MVINLFRILVFGTLSIFTFCDAQISVDTVNPISAEEQDYHIKRALYQYQGMEKFLNTNIPGGSVPKVLCCLSGGGYRAMISCTAFLQALEDIGALPAIAGISSLSGSTWMLGHMLARDSVLPQPISMQQFGQILKQNVVGVRFFDVKTFHWNKILDRLVQIHKDTGTIQVADVWGAVLFDRLMFDLQENNCPVQEITFEAVRRLLNTTLKYPFPIFTSSITNELPYWLIEVSPYAAGSDYLMAQTKHFPKDKYVGAYIPTYALGSIFEGGTCTKLFPEKNVGSMIGIFGSPYSMGLSDILKFLAQFIDNRIANYVENNLERRAIETAISVFVQGICIKYDLNQPRFLPSFVTNFLCRMNSFWGSCNALGLSDAGFAYNLPVLPLLKRGSDIIVICDASSDSDWKDHPEIYRARDAAWEHGFKFPALKNARQVNDHLIVYQDPDPSVPIVLYFVNSIVEPTLQFDYTSDEFDQLYNFMYELVIDNQKELRAAISAKLPKSGWCTLL